MQKDTTPQNRHELTHQPERLLRLPQVLKIVPIGKSTLWNYVANNRFPQPVRLSSRCTCWRQSDVDAWLANLAS